MSLDEVIDVVAVRDRSVATIGAVLVRFVVAAAIVARSAGGGIHSAHGQNVLFDLTAAWVVKMAFVQIIDVAFVENAGVPAIGAVFVVVVCVLVCHGQSPW